MIMRGEQGGAGGAWQRAAVLGLAAAALALTVGAGLFGRGAATAAAHMLEGVPQEGGRVVARSGRRGAESREQEVAVREIVEQSQEASVYFEQAAGAPVTITEAKMRMITREQLRRAEGGRVDVPEESEESPFLLTLPTVTVANTSAKAVHELGVGFETGGRVVVVAGYAAGLRPGESKTFRSEWRRRNVILPGTFADVKMRVIWVEFEDGTTWGTRLRARVPPPPPPPGAPDAPGVPEPPARSSGEGGDVGSGRAVASGRGDDVAIARSGGGGAVARSADAGGGFGEGSGEGSGAGSGGGGRGAGLGDKLYAPEPTYPPIARAVRAEGTVGVRVTVDEEGNVVRAEAVSGHPLLQGAAVDAARQSKFKPAVVDGKPVKVSAVISYVFTLK